MTQEMTQEVCSLLIAYSVSSELEQMADAGQTPEHDSICSHCGESRTALSDETLVCDLCGCITYEGEVVSNLYHRLPNQEWLCAIGEYELATAPEAKGS